MIAAGVLGLCLWLIRETSLSTHQHPSGSAAGSARNITRARLHRGSAARVLDGTVQPGKVFDRTVDLEAVPDGYGAMTARQALTVLVGRERERQHDHVVPTTTREENPCRK
jgi:hypothetical protein